jgi:hypothetical protein
MPNSKFGKNPSIENFDLVGLRLYLGEDWYNKDYMTKIMKNAPSSLLSAGMT